MKHRKPTSTTYQIHPVALVVGLWLIGLLLSLAIATWVDGNNANVIQQRLSAHAEQLPEQLSARMANYEKGIRGVRGAVLVGGMQHITPENFRIYMSSRELQREFPGANGFGFIERVTPEEMASFRAEMRLRDATFDIRQITPHDGERYVIKLIEPLEGNPGALGLDIASGQNRRVAALQAMRTGDATLTAPIKFLRSPNQSPRQSQRAFLLLLPVYHSGMALDSITQREAATVGWTYAPLLIDQIMHDFASRNDELAIQISDVTAPKEAVPFFNQGSRAPDTAQVWKKSFQMQGRQWQLEARPTSAFIKQLHLTPPGMVLTQGALTSLLLALLVAARANSRRGKRSLAAQQSLLANIVDNSTDAIIVVDLDGQISNWNQQATLLFGYQRIDAMGQRITELLVPAERHHEAASILTRCAAGARIPAFDTQRRHHDGSLLDVSVTAIPVSDGSGQVTAVAKVVRDIRQQKQAERALKDANARLELEVDEHSDKLQSAQRDLRITIDAMPSMIGYWDKHQINRFANRAYAEVLGIDHTAIPGVHLRDLLGDEYEQRLPSVEAVLRGMPQHFEATHALPGAGHRHTMTHFLPDIINDEVQGFYALTTDITEITSNRQQLSDLLRESEALMQTIHQHSLVSITDNRGLIIDANKAFCTLSGYAREELLGQDHRIVNSGVQSRQFWKSMWLSMKRGKPWRGEICNRAKDGSLYWVDSTIAPFHDEQGRVTKYISIRTDITANKHAQRRLAENEAFLERASQVSGVGSVRSDLKTGQVIWSKKAYQIHEVDESTPVSHTLVDSMLTPEVRLQMHEAMRIAGETGKGFDIEMPLRTARGRSIWLHNVGDVELENGVPVAVIGAIRDITQQRAMEMALRASESFLARVGTVAGVGGWEVDLTNDTVLWSPETHLLHEVEPGYIPTVATGLQFYTPEFRPIIAQAVQDCIEHARPFDLELEMNSAQGRRFWARAIGTAEVENGKVVRLVGAFQDITERRNYEQKLSAVSSLLKMVLDSASEVSIIATDPELVITVFNAGAERLLGYSSEEFIGRSTPVVFHDAEEMRERAAQLSGQLGRTIAGGAVFTEPSTLRQPREWTYICKDGRRVAVSLVVTPMYAQDSTLIGYLGIAHDITHQQQYEASLRVAMQQAENANLAKSEFLANMSHEIRTPLNAVIGLGYLLEQTSLSTDQQSMLNKIQFAGRALLGVINNVLDLSKIEAGEMTLEEVPCDLLELQQEIGAMLREQAQKKGLELLVLPQINLPAHLHCDATRLRQMLINLLNNAIKFTAAGQVALHTSVIERKQNMVRMRFAVRDTGIGISPEVIGKLFRPFAQADTSTTRRFGGTGLGLSITRRFVELMGGDIGVNSEVGVGSEFWMELPLRIDGSASGKTFTDLNILVAEAAGDTPQGLGALARSLGWNAHSVKNGSDVTAYLRATPHASWPNVLLIDATLADIDAQTLSVELAHEFGDATLPPQIIVLDQHCNQAPQWQTAAVMARPITSSMLFNTVTTAMVRRDTSVESRLIATHGNDERAQWLPGVQVLVADDSEVNLEVARRILEKQGAIVTTCSDGAAAVAQLRATSGIDIVLMDIQMPVLDGNEATRCIRTDLQLALPIIALTAGALVSERQRSLECGMNDFLTKPFEPQALIRMVRRHVERARGALPVILDHVTSSSQPKVAMSSIDSDAVQRMFGDNQALFIKLLGRVLSDNAEFALPMTMDASDSARETLRSKMHKLKGSAGLLGAMTVHRLAGAAERALEQNEPAEFVEVIMAQLATALTTLHEEATPQLNAAAALVRNEAAPPVTPEEMTELLALMENQNFAAVDKFEAVSASLRGMLASNRFELLQRAMEQLDFQQAAELLRNTEPQTGMSSRTLAQ